MSSVRPLTIAFACAALTSSLASQSLVTTVEAVTDLSAAALEPRPALPPLIDTATLLAGSNIPDGFDLVAQSFGTSTYGSVDVSIQDGPHIVTIEESTFAQVAGIPDSQSTVGQHTYRITFTPTRDYSGDLVIRWNGILQNLGVGLATCLIDVDANGSIDFINGNGASVEATFNRSFSPANPLEVDVTMSSLSIGSEFSVHHVLVEVEFLPDANTVAPGSFKPTNFGCPTSEGLVPLFNEPAPLTGPLVGETFTTRIQNVPAVSPGVVGMLGPPLPPTNLGFLGMDFCFLFTNPVFAFPMALPVPGPSTRFWDLAVPNQTSLVGVTFRQQVLILDDPLHNDAGAVITNSGDCVIGGV